MAIGSRSVALLGASDVIGRLLLDRLAEDVGIERIVVTGKERPEGLPKKASFVSMDVMSDVAIDRLADLIDDKDLDTIVHMGFLTARKEMQERQREATAQIIRALARRPVPKIIFTSTTAVYGALPGDPTHLSETAPLVQDPNSDWVRDKVAAEHIIGDFRLESDSTITTLRFALPLGPTIDTFMTRYLKRKAVPVVMGIDPPVQFVHERDVAAAIHHSITAAADGVFNIVGDGALPLSVALRIGRRRSAPVPELGSYPLHHALWEPDIIEAPSVLQDLFRYVWVADGTKAAKVMKFSPRHSTKETVEDFYKPKNRR